MDNVPRQRMLTLITPRGLGAQRANCYNERICEQSELRTDGRTNLWKDLWTDGQPKILYILYISALYMYINTNTEIASLDEGGERNILKIIRWDYIKAIYSTKLSIFHCREIFNSKCRCRFQPYGKIAVRFLDAVKTFPFLPQYVFRSFGCKGTVCLSFTKKFHKLYLAPGQEM